MLKQFSFQVIFILLPAFLLLNPSAAVRDDGGEVPPKIPTQIVSSAGSSEAPDDVPELPERDNQFIHQYLRQEDETLQGHTLETGAHRPPVPHEDAYVIKHVAYEHFPDQPMPGQGLRDAARDSSLPRDGPPGRWLHSAVWTKGQMVVFGGVSNNPRSLVNDVWAFEYNEQTWMQLRFPTAEGTLFPNPRSHGERDRTEFSPRPPNIPEGPAYINPPDAPKATSQWLGLTPKQRVDHFRSYNYGSEIPLVLPTVPQPVQGGPLFAETSEMAAEFLEVESKIAQRARSISSLRLLHMKIHKPATQAHSADQLLAQTRASAAKARFASARTARATDKANTDLKADSKADSKADLTESDPRLVLPGAPYTPLVQQLVENTANDLWTFNIANLKWTHSDKVGLAPVPRWLHTAVIPKLSANQIMDVEAKAPDENLMWVYGGCSNALTLLNDVWKFDISAQTWTNITPEDEPTKDSMLPREGHSAVVLKDNQMTVFGGMSYSYEPLSDMWMFDGTKWTAVAKNKVSKMTTEPKFPPARWMHSAVAIEGPEGGTVFMFVYGGCSGDFTAMDDLWVFSERDGWSGIAALSYDRDNPTNSIDHRSLRGPAGQILLDPDNYPPPARWLHASAAAGTVNGRRLVVHGGAAGNIALDDMWMLDTDQCLEAIAAPASGAGCVWTEVYPAGAFPFAREGHSAIVVTHPQAPDARSKPPPQILGAAQKSAGEVPIFDDTHATLNGKDALENLGDNGSEERPGLDEIRQRFKDREVWRDLFVVIFGGAGEAGTIASSVVHL